MGWVRRLDRKGVRCRGWVVERGLRVSIMRSVSRIFGLAWSVCSVALGQFVLFVFLLCDDEADEAFLVVGGDWAG